MDHLIECQCKDCGKKFYKGDEGDNEKFCLRCESEYIYKVNEQNDYDEHGDL